jgi:hypothetical protein
MTERIVKAICGATDKPLELGKVKIQCYVLEDERRVLVQGGMIKALGISHGGSGSTGGDRLAKFTHQQRLKSFVSNATLVRTVEPIRFRTTSGSMAYGYEAEVLAGICFAILDAAKAGALQKQQQHIAEQCDMIVRGFALVGINALVDEATGYQQVRERRALAKILEKYIAEEYRGWTKRFPDDFYREMFRLKGWTIDPLSVKRPGVIGKYTNDIVYERLAPGVLKELQRKNPVTEAGYRRRRHHQWLTGDYGDPRLKEHIVGVLALMRAAPKWNAFKRLLERVYPKFGDTLALPFDDAEI